ncbi:MAG: universal stress protein [Chloroflexota bacterium]|nr:MAG: universal stress protein [Chloroflexota bacterium]
MDETEKQLTIKRILVALDASTHSLAALDAAAALAATLEAELLGLFVEDENLIHLAGLPFSQEVRAPSAASHEMSSDRMEKDLRLQAAQAQRALQEAADRVQARWSFRTVRGQVTPAILAAALDADLVAMGRVSHPVSRGNRLGSTARATTADTRRSVLLMQQGSDLSYPVLVTFDSSPAAWQALLAAARLARAGDDVLGVLLLNETPESVSAMKDEVSAWLRERGLKAQFSWLPEATVGSLIRLVQSAADCVLVLGGENPLLEASSIQELLDQTDCPVLLVR